MACRSLAGFRVPVTWPRYGGHEWQAGYSLRRRAFSNGILRSSQPESHLTSDEPSGGLASLPLHQLTLAELVKHGRPPLSEAELLASANFTSKLIPIRLAHRVRALENLPYIIVSNPNIARILQNYQKSLTTLGPYHDHEITTIKEEADFTEALAELVKTHSNTIPILAKGFLDSRRYVTSETATKFLDQHLLARIGTRLIAEQHIMLHCDSQPDSGPPDDTHIGIIDTALRPLSVIRGCEDIVGELCELRYGVRPTIEVDGMIDATIVQIRSHLEYILTEVLKNAFRATAEAGREAHQIQVTIAVAKGDPHQGGVSGGKVGGGLSTPGDETLTIRIRDRGGGIAPEYLEDIWKYSFTTFKEEPISDFGMLDALTSNNTSSIAGLGYGLPLSRAYAEYFGGNIQLESMHGWGTDVYVRMKGLPWIDHGDDKKPT